MMYRAVNLAALALLIVGWVWLLAQIVLYWQYLGNL